MTTLASNPSHLEAVDPVVEGRARAVETDPSTRRVGPRPSSRAPRPHPRGRCLSRPGNCRRDAEPPGAAGYFDRRTPIPIGNNQIGFTTDPADGRSTRYSSDLAKGFDIPIVHVNADDAEASDCGNWLALAYGRASGQGHPRHLIGYRRHGHNEWTRWPTLQPPEAEKIAAHPSARAPGEVTLAKEGAASAERLEELARRAQDAWRTRAAVEVDLRPRAEIKASDEAMDVRAVREEIVTAVPADVLAALNQEPLSVRRTSRSILVGAPAGAADREAPDRRIDWGQAESLAFATLLVEGIPIRLTGQDTERGTFSQRHIVLHDVETGERYAPIQNLQGAQASFEVHNSPLSELAAVGSEYGYLVSAPEALVLWGGRSSETSSTERR